MRGVDLHPEDLLEAAARGQLSVGEWKRLEWHLAQCEVCRFERLAREDFRRELEHQDEGLDVSRLLSQALLGDTEVPAVASSGRRTRRVRLGLLAAAMVTIAGTAAAAVGFSEMRVVARGAFETETQVTDSPARAEVNGVVASSTPISTSGLTSPTTLPTPTTEAAPPPAPPPPLPSARAAMASGATSPQHDAAALFARANGARRSGDQERATSLYRSLIERYRSSSEAHEAEAVLGRMLLDSSDAGDALSYFDDYLDTEGALREDVMRDRAVALQLLGRADDEASAWAALLQAYPASVHAERARKRLSELGKR
jgi:TolA-binding protein